MGFARNSLTNYPSYASEMASLKEAISLVPVTLSPLRTPSLAWPKNANHDAVRAFSCCMPLPNEPPTTFLSGETQLGYAEFYGGAGVAGNAGGVRCANVGPYQIKGIGPTRLAGRTTDKWHRHGACSLQDAVKEAIFSEILHSALPNGTSRAIAVVPTGTNFATEVGEEKLPGQAPRALFVRQPIVRLAHFLRSGFSSAPEDIKRQELAGLQLHIPNFCDALIRAAGLGSSNSSVRAEMVMPGLLEMYARQLEQVAFLQTRRLIHGSLIPSNVGIDGKLVDFTTTTAQATFDSLLVAPGGYPSERQHWQILQSIDEVIFHISKFDQRCKLSRSEMTWWGQWLLENASGRHYAAMSRAWLDIIGLTSAEISVLGASTRRELADAIARLVAESRSEAAVYFGGDEHRMPTTAPGRDFRCALLHTVLFAQTRSNGGEHLKTRHALWPSGFSERTRTALLAAYLKAYSELGGQESDLRAADSDHMAQRSSRLLCRVLRILRFTNPMERLHRRAIDGTIDAAVRGGNDLNELISSYILEFGNRLGINQNDEIFLQAWAANEEIIITPDHRALANFGRLEATEILNAASKLEESEASILRDVYFQSSLSLGSQ